MKFDSTIEGHHIILDALPLGGGSDSGPRPKSLMLTALAGCTGMDVVSYLKKMRAKIEYFNVSVTGYLTDDFPKHYNKIHIVFELKGSNLTMDKINQAIKLSEEKYCGVWAVYRKTMEITKEVILLK